MGAAREAKHRLPHTALLRSRDYAGTVRVVLATTVSELSTGFAQRYLSSPRKPLRWKSGVPTGAPAGGLEDVGPAGLLVWLEAIS